MLWYKAGIDARQCHKVPLPSRREILVCLGQYGAQGNISTALYVEDLLAPVATLMAGSGHFFEVTDNTLSCGWNQDDELKPYLLARGYIERVIFGTSKTNGQSTISVTAQIGTREMKPEDVRACMDKRNPANPINFFPPAKSYRVDFVFDGHGYKRAQ
jgi:hypothetical protein